MNTIYIRILYKVVYIHGYVIFFTKLCIVLCPSKFIIMQISAHKLKWTKSIREKGHGENSKGSVYCDKVQIVMNVYISNNITLTPHSKTREIEKLLA